MSRYRILDSHELYFITFCVVGWIDALNKRKYKDIIIDSLHYCRQHKSLLVRSYVLMSNHVHFILQTAPDSCQHLSDTLRDLKKFTANSILDCIQNGNDRRKDWLLHLFRYHAKYNTNNREFQFWQQDNHPIRLKTPAMVWQKINYIHQNPVKAGIVRRPEDYVYSSAQNYLQDNKTCKMDIDLLDPWWSDVGRIRT